MLGAVERTPKGGPRVGKVRAMVVGSPSGGTGDLTGRGSLQFLQRSVDPDGSLLILDEYAAYEAVSPFMPHLAVNPFRALLRPLRRARQYHRGVLGAPKADSSGQAGLVRPASPLPEALLAAAHCRGVLEVQPPESEEPGLGCRCVRIVCEVLLRLIVEGRVRWIRENDLYLNQAQESSP